MSTNRTGLPGQPGNEGVPPGARAAAFERLIDQLIPGSAHVPPELRAARRLCGRWLLMRRALRQLSREDIALRTGLSEGALELLEQGLLGDLATYAEAWPRLALVLEHHQTNDWARVTAAIDVARGAAASPDPQFLSELEAEIATPEEAPAPQPAPEAIALELLDILAAIKYLRAPATAYQVKKWIAEQRGKSWNPADLPRTLADLVQEGLLSRSEGRPASYALTEVGVEALALAEQRERIREAKRINEEELAHIEQSFSAFAGLLRPLAG